MVLHFKYKLVARPDKSLAKCPCIPVVLSGKEEKLETVCILDSGAETCTIPWEVAQVMGLKLSKKEKSWGIGGQVESSRSEMYVLLRGKHDERYCFKVPVYVIKSQIPCLIGRKEFFNKFVIKIDEAKQKITLKRNTHRH